MNEYVCLSVCTHLLVYVCELSLMYSKRVECESDAMLCLAVGDVRRSQR